MGQIQQMCSTNVLQVNSSLYCKSMQQTKKRTTTDNSSSYTDKIDLKITETIPKVKIIEFEKENYDVETNISQVESTNRNEQKNLSAREMDEITDSNQLLVQQEIKNRSKSLSIQFRDFEFLPKGILKNKETTPEVSEKRNTLFQKKVRFSFLNTQKQKRVGKYQHYTKVSYL